MGEEKHKKFLTVAPFECAWHEELRFREAGRGSVAFEAFAQNDVTLVFREQVGSQHYHYKMNNSPNYTVILGSHRNRRLKIEVDGKTVVDVAGIGLCCSSPFQSYWISIYDGLISIGKSRHPFQNMVFQWLDSNPNCSVQYVGLSSWDKHVGYRNIIVLPLTQGHTTLWNHIDYKEYGGEIDGERQGDDPVDFCENWGLMNFLENWDLSDVLFVVGAERKAVPAHKIVESQLGCLRDLSIQFQVSSLIKQCEEIIDRFKTNKKLFDSSKKVEITSRSYQEWQSVPRELPSVVRNLKKFLASGEHSDVNLYIKGKVSLPVRTNLFLVHGAHHSQRCSQME